MSIINKENTGYKTGHYPVFLGERLGLQDTVNVTYPKYFEFWEKQKSQDWHFTEVSLDQSRKDFVTCSQSMYDIMIKTLSFQLEGDSVATNIFTLLAPFLSNTEAARWFLKVSDIEALHSSTYSEIVRQCIKNPQDIFDQIVTNENISDRMVIVEKVLSDLEIAGSKYRLGLIEADDDLRLLILKGMFALTVLEGIQFLSSFAATFALAEQGVFVGIAKLVQKVMLDEALHSIMDVYTITDVLLKDPKWEKVYNENIDELREILDAGVKQEEDWAEYIFSEGRIILGMNEESLKEWTYYNAGVIYKRLKLPVYFKVPKTNPFVWMENWTNPDKVQAAAQEIQLTNYKLNTGVKDFEEDEEFDF